VIAAASAVNYYGQCQANGWFIGSGVIEAGCMTVVGRRLRQSGMFWSEHGAEEVQDDGRRMGCHPGLTRVCDCGDCRADWPAISRQNKVGDDRSAQGIPRLDKVCRL